MYCAFCGFGQWSESKWTTASSKHKALKLNEFFFFFNGCETAF